MNVFALFLSKVRTISKELAACILYICQKVSEKMAINRAEANIRRLARSHLSLFVTPSADNVVQFKAVDAGDGGWWQKFNLVTK